MLDDGELYGMNENESPKEEPPPACARETMEDNTDSDKEEDNSNKQYCSQLEGDIGVEEEDDEVLKMPTLPPMQAVE